MKLDISEIKFEEAYDSEKADSFECVCKLSKEAAMAIFGIRDAVLKCCPNKRVTHLASSAKKSRTRKKNLRRAIKILEKMENKDAL